MYFSSANKELRALLTPAVRQQLRTDYEAATALCLKVGKQSCKELREATEIRWCDKGLTAADLATLATLASLLPALEWLILREPSGSAGLDGVPRLTKGLVAGALPALAMLIISGMHVGDAGAAALSSAAARVAHPASVIWVPSRSSRLSFFSPPAGGGGVPAGGGGGGMRAARPSSPNGLSPR